MSQPISQSANQRKPRILFISSWDAKTLIPALEEKGFEVTKYEDEVHQLMEEVCKCKEESRPLILITAGILYGAKLYGEYIESGYELALRVKEVHPESLIVGYSTEPWAFNRLRKCGIDYRFVDRSLVTDADVPRLVEAVLEASAEFPSSNQARILNGKRVDPTQYNTTIINLPVAKKSGY